MIVWNSAVLSVDSFKAMTYFHWVNNEATFFNSFNQQMHTTVI